MLNRRRILSSTPTNKIIDIITADRTVAYVAFLWGMAEGLFFFIVPDVFILFAASFSLKNGLRAWMYSIIGSLVSVITLWMLTLIFLPTDLLQLLAKLPGVTPELNAQVLEQLSVHGLPFTFLLVLGGVPLKVYTLNAFALNYSLLLILGWALFARVARIGPGFLLMIAIKHVFGKKIDSYPMRWTAIYLGLWVIFYIYYFKKMGI